jgi:creatinine amidohydrolase
MLAAPGTAASAGSRRADLADLTWPEVAELSATGAFLVVPVGSTEQHGPHLPLSTDTDIAVALSQGLAERRADAVIAPPLVYGSSGEHAGFAGTLSIGQAALELVLIELCRSATDTFAHVLLVSAHGGNSEPVARAVRQLTEESRDVSVFSPRWTGDPHAGRAETSLQLAHRPELVRFERAVLGDVRPLREVFPLLREGGVRAVSPSGILGDPRTASAAEGAALFDELLAALLSHVDAWRR